MSDLTEGGAGAVAARTRGAIRAVRRRWLVAVLTLLVVGGAAAGLIVARPIPATAVATVGFTPVQGTDPQLFGQLAMRYPVVATAPQTVDAVAQELGVSGRLLHGATHAEIPADSSILRIAVTWDDAEIAAQAANALARTVVDRAAEDDFVDGSVLAPAHPALVSEGPAAVWLWVLAAGVAVLAAVLVAVATDRLWPGVQLATDRHDPARVLEVPLLGEVPEFGAVGVVGTVPTVSAPQSVAAEAFHFIVQSLQSAALTGSSRTILITSPSPADGKTITALNLAVAARRDRDDVILVDADKRVRGLTRLADLEGAEGLSNLAELAVPVEWCLATWALSDEVTLSLVPAGSAVDDPAAFFRRPGFRTALQRIKEQGGFVLLDCPPLLAVSDTSAIAGHVDGIVLVVNRDTPMPLLQETRQRLDLLGSPVLGYIFNRVDPRRSRYGLAQYGYGYGYGEEAPTGDEPKVAWWG